MKAARDYDRPSHHDFASALRACTQKSQPVLADDASLRINVAECLRDNSDEVFEVEVMQ